MANSFKKLHNQVMSDPIRRTHVEEIQRAMVTAHRISEHREIHSMANEVEPSELFVACIAREPDLYLTTLRDYLELIGGRLELTAVFDDERIALVDDRDSTTTT